MLSFVSLLKYLQLKGMNSSIKLFYCLLTSVSPTTCKKCYSFDINEKLACNNDETFVWKLKHSDATTFLLPRRTCRQCSSKEFLWCSNLLSLLESSKTLSKINFEIFQIFLQSNVHVIAKPFHAIAVIFDWKFSAWFKPRQCTEVFVVGLHCEFHAETCLRTEFNSKLHAISVARVLRLKEISTRMSRHTPPGTQRPALEKCFNLQRRMEMRGLMGVYWMWILMCFALVGNIVGVGWTYFQLMVTAACGMLI